MTNGVTSSSDSSAVITAALSPSSGVTLDGETVTATSGTASFTDFEVIATPGNYDLSLSASWRGNSLQWRDKTNSASASVAIALTVTHADPADLVITAATSDARNAKVFGFSQP